MNINQERELAEKIASLLKQSVCDLDSQTTAKLLEARKEALAHFQEQPARGWAPAWVSATASRITEPFSHNLRAGIVLLALLTSLAAFVTWQTFGQQGSDLAEVDQALLTDELPINAYLDKGFDSWLKRP
jgi:hypothetical protein